MSDQQTIRFTLDEFNHSSEGESCATLVHEDGGEVVVPRRYLPDCAQLNQILTVTFAIDADSTDARKEEVRRLQHRLFHRDPGGD